MGKDDIRGGGRKRGRLTERGEREESKEGIDTPSLKFLVGPHLLQGNFNDSPRPGCLLLFKSNHLAKARVV